MNTEGVAAAVAALNEMLSPEQCRLLVEAIINKYIVLSAEELQEWQVHSFRPNSEEIFMSHCRAWVDSTAAQALPLLKYAS